MSNHIEWGEAHYATPRLYIAQPGEIDNGDAVNEKPALIIDEGGDFFVLEGTREELLAFGLKIAQLAQAFVEQPQHHEPDEQNRCLCEAPTSTLRNGRWICNACDKDTDIYADDEEES